MEIEKDGLYTYMVSDAVCDAYFLSVEYPVLRYNSPGTLLPMLLREQDGDTRLLYDISDARSLREIAAGRHFSRQDCRDLLRDLTDLLHDLEELMLEPSRIPFSPDCIYQAGDGHFRWMYRPDQEYDLQKEVQEYFAWMLSEIDYGDSETVRFVYHVYWMIRNRALNEGLLKSCMDFAQPRDAVNITSYESFFREELSEEKAKEPDVNESVGAGTDKPASSSALRKKEADMAIQKQRQERTVSGMPVWDKKWTGLEIFLLLLLLADAAWLCTAGVLLIRQGRAPYTSRSWVAGILLLLLFAEGIWQCHKRRKMGEKGRESDAGISRYPEAAGQADGFGWTDEEGQTVRLDNEMLRVQPFLLDEGSGEKIPMEVFPFVIGNVRGMNHLAVSDRAVSRRHAMIERGGIAGTYQIRDLGSTNGTWMNQKKIGNEAVRLKDGDILCFAERRYRFYTEGGTEAGRRNGNYVGE